VLRREETIQRASGALNVLENARIVATLDQALDGMTPPVCHGHDAARLRPAHTHRRSEHFATLPKP
jgi:tRNA/rRNA methyltransferase